MSPDPDAVIAAALKSATLAVLDVKAVFSPTPV
jgi:hypothetical protein